MDFIRFELEEKYFADVEPREECIAFSVYIKSGDFSGRGTFVYTVNEFRQLISQLKINIYYIRWSSRSWQSRYHNSYSSCSRCKRYIFDERNCGSF